MIVIPPNIIWRMHGVEPRLDFSGPLTKNLLIGLGVWLVLSGGITAYWLYGHYQRNEWARDCKKAREQGAEQLITYAYSLATKSVDTIDFTKCQIVSERRAERDSLRAAKQMKKFVKNTGITYIGYKTVGVGRFVNKPILIKGAVIKDPKYQELSRNYQIAAQQCVARRKICGRGQ